MGNAAIDVEGLVKTFGAVRAVAIASTMGPAGATIWRSRAQARFWPPSSPSLPPASVSSALTPDYSRHDATRWPQSTRVRCRETISLVNYPVRPSSLGDDDRPPARGDHCV